MVHHLSELAPDTWPDIASPRLACMWTMQPKELGDKVKLFFQKYAINRHKACVITPSYLCEQYCPDDNRLELMLSSYLFTDHNKLHCFIH